MLHHNIIPSRALVILLTICIIANNLPIIESQSAQSCVAKPCAYKDECANKFSECGAGDAYCNVESLWRPFCGGGGNLERTASPTPQPTRHPQSTTPPPPPLPLPLPSSPPPTPQPTLRNTPKPTTNNRPATNRPTMNRQPTNRPQSDPTLPPQLSSILSPQPPAPTPPKVTSNPTTSFEGWLNDKDPSNNNNGEGGGDVSSSNVDYTQTANNNETGWFDKEGWDSSRGQEEDGGSAFNFWGGNNNNGGASCLENGRGAFHVTLLVVGTTLYYAFGGV